MAKHSDKGSENSYFPTKKDAMFFAALLGLVVSLRMLWMLGSFR